MDKHAQKQMTSVPRARRGGAPRPSPRYRPLPLSTQVIHGKWAHEESVATASMAQHYIIIKDLEEAREIAAYIMGEEGALTDEELLEKYKNAVSEGWRRRRPFAEAAPLAQECLRLPLGSTRRST